MGFLFDGVSQWLLWKGLILLCQLLLMCLDMWAKEAQLNFPISPSLGIDFPSCFVCICLHVSQFALLPDYFCFLAVLSVTWVLLSHQTSQYLYSAVLYTFVDCLSSLDKTSAQNIVCPLLHFSLLSSDLYGHPWYCLLPAPAAYSHSIVSLCKCPVVSRRIWGHTVIRILMFEWLKSHQIDKASTMYSIKKWHYIFKNSFKKKIGLWALDWFVK